MKHAVPFVLLLACTLAAQNPQQRPRRGPDRRFQGDQYARAPEPQKDVTIFSPLDLAAPNAYRTGSGAPGPDYWQQEVNYQIDVTLEPETRLVKGKEHVAYVNHSPDPLDYIWVYLEQNILRADSIGSEIGGQRAVGGASSPSDGVTVASVAAAGKPLSHQIYDTTMRIELPATLAPGSTVEFDVEWSFAVPTRVFRRYGTIDTKHGTVWEIAQWFPAVAVYDDVHGWNTLPYLGTGEFYNNFGTFDVNITVPHDHMVVATGVLQNPDEVYTETQRKRLAEARKSADTVMVRSADEVGSADTRPAGDGPLTWRFHADKVRTFAWASSPAFILDAASLGDTLIQSAYYDEVADVWSKSTQMLRFAIDGYDHHWSQYPYPVATNVAGVERGMEYPMIIFCRGRSERGLYGVTCHEIGHNWFPMVVNTDERRHAWMDEGFNTFINIYSESEYFKEPEQLRGSQRAFVTMMPGMVPIDTPADRLGGMQLGMLEYRHDGARAADPARVRARPRALRLRVPHLHPALEVQVAAAGGLLPHDGGRVGHGPGVVLPRLVPRARRARPGGRQRDAADRAAPGPGHVHQPAAHGDAAELQGHVRRRHDRAAQAAGRAVVSIGPCSREPGERQGDRVRGDRSGWDAAGR